MTWRAAPFPARSSTMRFLLLAFGLLLVAPYVTRAADEPPAMVDPCTLLHEKDAMDVLQKPVKSTPTRTGALPTCLYKATPWGRVALTVYGTTETFEKRVDFAKFMWKEEPQDIPGLGDQAKRVGGQILVEKKSVIFAVFITAELSEDERNKHLLELAKLAVSRLP